MVLEGGFFWVCEVLVRESSVFVFLEREILWG